MVSNVSFLHNLGLHLLGCSWCSQRWHCPSMTTSLKADLHASWKFVPSSSISLRISYPTKELFIVAVVVSIIICSVMAGHFRVYRRVARPSTHICWASEWMNEYMLDPNLCSVRPVSQGLDYPAWDVCSINSAQVSKTNFAFQLLPRLLLETRSKKAKAAWALHHQHYCFTLSSTSHSLLLPSLSVLNALIVFSKHPTGERRGHHQNH